jgi:hypothetical protein
MVGYPMMDDKSPRREFTVFCAVDGGFRLMFIEAIVYLGEEYFESLMWTKLSILSRPIWS